MIMLTGARTIDLSISMINSTLNSLGQHLRCNSCKASLNARVREIILNWSEARVSYASNDRRKRKLAKRVTEHHLGQAISLFAQFQT